ncbi:DUF523 domain-containing protein [Patescibacteria group bacterium]|nr:DUF523 domain-containing protein [Patescibacteria group bacterium]
MEDNKNKDNLNQAISACLLGIPCRWNEKGKNNPKAIKEFLKGKSLIICPEVLAGLPTPRPACEISSGDGKDVLAGKAKIVDKYGIDYTEVFIKGAKLALDIIQKNEIKKVLLKSGSPTCGALHIYTGDFSGQKKKGLGVFAALLQAHGIEIEELD